MSHRKQAFIIRSLDLIAHPSLIDPPPQITQIDRASNRFNSLNRGVVRPGAFRLR